MSDDLEEFVFCWKCNSKIDTEAQSCPKCKMPLFSKDGDEIVCQEQYDDLKKMNLL